MSIPIYVINLPDVADRRNRIEKHLNELNITEFEIVSAIRGSLLSTEELSAVYDDRKTRNILGRSMQPGEIGCALSHIKAFRNLLKSDKPYALIIEDDALLSKTVSEIIENPTIKKWLTSSKARIVLLTTLSQFLQRFSIKIDECYRVVKVGNAWFTHGYLINSAAAERLIACNTPVKFLADQWIEHSKMNSIDIRGLDPFCIGLHQSSLESQIEDVRHYKNIDGSIVYFVRYYWRKIIRRLADILYYKPVYGFGSHDSIDNKKFT